MKAFKLVMGLIMMTLFFSACDSLDELTKSPLERSIEQVTQEWTVDTIRYVRYNLDGSVYSDIIQPTGKMIFEKLETSSTNPVLFFNHGFVFHNYDVSGVLKTDTTAWSYGVDSDVKIKYINIFYKDVKDKTYSAGKTIFDIKELSDKKLYIYREEMLVDVKTGSTYGRLKSIMRMHR